MYTEKGERKYMPELPEVEVICRGIRPELLGRTFQEVRFSGKNLRQPVDLPHLQQLCKRGKITHVFRRAKYLLLQFAEGETLIFHLGMTGRLGFYAPQEKTAKHDHLFFLLDNGREMRFNDTRRFGSVTLLDSQASPQMENTFFAQVGPEPFDPDCTAQTLMKKAQEGRSKVSIKAFLMTGKFIAGIGNIYANESLFAAALHPATPASSLTLPQWQLLLTSIREILHWAIDCGGSTISDFVNASREQGYFQANFKVYGRTGQPCIRCGTPLAKETIAGRASFYCPHCQKRCISP